MRNEYFDTDDFKYILDKYEASEEQGTTCYFDAEDFVDLADYFLLSDRPDDAMHVVELGLSQHEEDDDLKSVKSAVLIFLHRFEEAREVLDLVKDRDDSNVLYQTAQLTYALDGDLERAEELFTDWIEYEEKNSKHSDADEYEFRIRDAYLHVITSFIELNENYDEEVVKRWVEEYYVRFAPLGGNEADLILADLVRNEAMSDMIEKIYTSLLDHDPYINHGWTVLGVAQVMNEHYEDALESADFALAINPDDIDALLNKAHAYYSLGQKDKAITYFERYFGFVDDASQYLPYAISLLTQERQADAKKYMEKAEEYVVLNKDSKDYYATANAEMSEAYVALGDNDAALRCILRSLEVYPQEANFHLQHVTVLLVRDEYEECVAAFTLCFRYANSKIWSITQIVHRFIMQQQGAMALHLLDSMAPQYADDPEYRTISAYRALALLQVGEKEEFLANLKKACEECPDVLQFLFWDKFPETVKAKDYYDYIMNNPL